MHHPEQASENKEGHASVMSDPQHHKMMEGAHHPKAADKPDPHEWHEQTDTNE